MEFSMIYHFNFFTYLYTKNKKCSNSITIISTSLHDHLTYLGINMIELLCIM